MTRPDVLTVATARNGALREAGYPDGCSISRKEYEDDGARFTDLDRTQRNVNLGQYGVLFSPADRVMVYAIQIKEWEYQSLLSKKRQADLNRPVRLLIDGLEAKDKRGRVRRWESQKAALREARKIERELVGAPKRARVGMKSQAATPPGALLDLMENGRAGQ